MQVEKLSPQKVIHWLNKTKNTINNLPPVLDISRNYRANELVIRYDELKEKAIEFKIWKDFCDKMGADYSHNGFDLLA